MSPHRIAFLLALAGIATTAAIARGRARRLGLSVRTTIDGLFAMIAAGLVTGHATDVLLYRWPEYANDWTVVLPGSGGSCSLGAVGGALFAGFVWFRRRDPEKLLDHADNVMAASTLGWGIARLGCFAVHDHLSAVTNSPLAIDFPEGARHDLGLYEAILSFALFFLLRWLDKKKRSPGSLAIAGALTFAAGRFALDFLRVGDPRYGGLTLVQLAAIAVAMFAVARPFVTSVRRACSPPRVPSFFLQNVEKRPRRPTPPKAA